MQFRFGLFLAIPFIVGVLSYRNVTGPRGSDQWIRHTHEVLENLEGMLSCQDGPHGGNGFFFIVPVTDTIGGEAITKPVREKLAGCDQIQQTALTYSVSYRLLRSANRSANESMENYIGRMAMKIQETVDEVISPRTVKNEQ
jgi:hypothetical protein